MICNTLYLQCQNKNDIDMRKTSEHLVKIDDYLALTVANCRDEHRLYVINDTTFQWCRKLFAFLVNGVQKTPASVYADLSCDYAKMGRVSFIEYYDI